MSDERLRKCPFCGGVPIVFESSNGPFAFGKYVVCGKCGCQTLLYTGKDAEEKAIESWNNRKPVEDVLERLEEEYKAAADDMKRCLRENPLQFDSAKGCAQGLYNAIKIIKERML